MLCASGCLSTEGGTCRREDWQLTSTCRPLNLFSKLSNANCA